MFSFQIRRSLVIGVGAVGFSYTVTPKVYADDGKKKMKIADLPIYGDPKEMDLVLVPETVSPYREKVSEFRKIVFKYLDGMQDTTDKVKQKWEVSKAHTNDLIRYLQEDSGALPRAAFITVAGLGGVVAGYKGGVIRKTFFGAGGILTAAAICYPNEAVDITRTGWNRAKGQAYTWIGKEAKKEPKKTKKVEDEKKETSSKDKVVKEAKANTVQVDSTKLDHGMSKKEDKDLYSTRDS